ncbi:hypothetical protein bsdcttw_21630 [Anaerocolumna chitinilytica]|uniref:Uncharacterized protein n=1 Tax=Anaerocolumna chitinilytica TaxID=1727145 RepID=A0A7I8DLC5_9FIRM|nr:hypothetical protein bsdcttw_21630 [Anaerocolumna chitinilytica]
MRGALVGFEGKGGVVNGVVCPVVGAAEVEVSGAMVWSTGVVVGAGGVALSEEGLEGIEEPEEPEGEAAEGVAWAEEVTEGVARAESETTGVVVRAAVGMVKVSF